MSDPERPQPAVEGFGSALVIHCHETDGEPIAVLFRGDGCWKLRTVEPPQTETMMEIRRALEILSKQFKEEGF